MTTSILLFSCEASHVFCPKLEEKLNSLYQGITCSLNKCPRLTDKSDMFNYLSWGDPEWTDTTQQYLIISYQQNDFINWSNDPPIDKDDNLPVEFPIHGGSAYLFDKILKIYGKQSKIIFRSQGIYTLKREVSEFVKLEGNKRIIIIAHNDKTEFLRGERLHEGIPEIFNDHVDVVANILNYEIPIEHHGGNIDKYNSKYLKYKSKYLKLKYLK
jgi:hypothetical protein